ncbi:MAG: hypothetical protein ACFFD4_06490 [Candidatus Odinarchaeota archaeon]
MPRNGEKRAHYHSSKKLEGMVLNRGILIVIIAILVSTSGFIPDLDIPALDVQPVRAASGAYNEDFTTTTYQDLVITNVSGWGSGIINLPRKSLTLAGASNDFVPEDIFIDGNYAYVADFTDGLIVVNVTDPSNPVNVSSYATAGNANGVHVDGNIAYVADFAGGLQIVNITNPLNPVNISAYATSASAYDVYVEGNYAYVAGFTGGLQVVNITNPAEPTLAASVSISGWAFSVFVSGDYAYVAAYGGGLQVVNITDLSAPDPVGSCATPDYAWEVFIEGDYAYVACQFSGLQVINITNPSNPTPVILVDTPGAARGVCISGDFAYVADEHDGGLQVVDITDPTSPAIVGSYDTPGDAQRVAIDGNYAYVADGDSGYLQVISISDPATPTIVGNYPSSDFSRDVVVEGDYAYLADGFGNLKIINITDPSEPIFVSEYDTPGQPEGVSISGDYVFVAAGMSGGLQIINVSDPSKPTLLASFDTQGQASGVDVAGDYAYVADMPGGLQIFNITDPGNPFNVSSLQTDSFANEVAVAGDYAYVACHSAGLLVVNISDPLNPQNVSTVATPSQATDVAVAGNYAYVTDFINGLIVFNISDPLNPYPVGSYNDGSGYGKGVFVDGDRAYVADEMDGGLVILDISDPTSPTYVNSLDTPGSAMAVHVAGDYAYVADGSAGMQVIEVKWSRCRQFLSLATAQSTTVFTGTSSEPLTNVTLICSQSVPSGTSITYFLSANNGLNWELVTPGVEHFFSATGYELKWKAILATTNTVKTPEIFSLTISHSSYPFPVISGPGDFAMQENASGYSLLWNVVDGFTGNYLIYRNSTVIQEGDWTTTIFIWLNDTTVEVGKNNFTCVVTNAVGLSSSHEVWVTVLPAAPDVIAPSISGPADFSFEEGSIGYKIIWSGSDDRSPWWAKIWRDTTLVYDEPWIGNDIVISSDLEGLEAGTYSYNCTVYDEAGNWNSDIVVVTVFAAVPDSVPPDITPPLPLVYEEGTTGNNLTWICSDAHPYAYRVYINESEILFKPWHGENITVNVDGLTTGTWEVNLTIWDLSNNKNSAIVMVTVNPPVPDTTAPTVSIPADLTVAVSMAGTIIWEVDDAHPGVYTISKDGTTIIEQYPWASGIIQYTFTSLPEGTWIFKLDVWDEAGNHASSTAKVIVLPGSEYDTDAPQISHIPDLEIIRGSTNNTLTFHLFDQHPDGYCIVIDSVEVVGSIWAVPNIQLDVSIDGLDIGIHVVNVTGWDIFSNVASRLVTVTVVGDNTPPSLSPLPDVIAPEGTNETISWTVSDDNPSWFVIYNLTDGFSEITSGNWTSGSITLDISTFGVGTHHLRCVIYDQAGNYAVDDVILTIVSATTEPAPSPGFEFIPVCSLLLLLVIIRRSPYRKRR